MSTLKTELERPDANGRVLRFFPVENPSPRKLTAAQIQQFNEKGYIKGLPVFSSAEVDGIRASFDKLLKAILDANDGRDAYAINGYHTQCTSIWDVVTEPRILDYVQDILGPNFVAWGTHFFCKMPGDQRRVPWHQDASYWPLTPSKTVTVWLAIDDADVANGAMRVVPGTHRQGHLAFEVAKPGEKVVLEQKVIDPERFGTPVSFEMKAGQMSLHADMLVHGSEPNLSDRRRCGLTIRYATVDVRSTGGWNTGSVLCRGEDPDHYWANLPRPDGDSIAKKPWQEAQAGG